MLISHGRQLVLFIIVLFIGSSFGFGFVCRPHFLRHMWPHLSISLANLELRTVVSFPGDMDDLFDE